MSTFIISILQRSNSSEEKLRNLSKLTWLVHVKEVTLASEDLFLYLKIETNTFMGMRWVLHGKVIF